MERTGHKLADIVDIDRLQRICDDYVEAGGMTLAVLDPDGTVLVASGWQDICTRYHRRNGTTLAACLESDLRINDRMLAGLGAPEHIAYKCANGLWDVAFPLVVDGEHLANLFTGQFFYDDDVVDIEGFRRRAHDLGFDARDYIDALERVPVVTRQRVEQTMRFLADLVGMLGEFGWTRLQRDRDQAALLESEERFRQLFEAESDAVFLIDNETGRILEANGAAAIMYGYGRDEMLALTNEDLSAEPEQTQAVTHGTPVVADHVVTIPLRIHRRKDGSNFPVEITGRFFMLEGRAVHVAAIRDISERQNTAEALNESREILRAVLDAIPVRVFWKDRDLAYLGCNAPFAHDAGFEDPADLVGKDDYAMGWREQADLYRADDRLVIDSGEPRLLVEEPQTTPAGERLDLLTSKLPLRGARDEVIGVLGTYYDITERKRAERALHQSQRLYQTFINATDDMAFLKDEDLRYIIVNAALAAFFGRGIEEVVGCADEELMPATAAEACHASDLRARKHAGLVVTTEKQGDRVYESRKFPVALTDGRVGVGGYVRDVTEQRRAEGEIMRLASDLERRVRQRTEQLEATNRELSSFAYSISHDLRSPLRALDGFSEILLQDYSAVLDEEARGYLRRIKSAANHMADLMDGLLQLSRLNREELVLERIDLSRLARDVVDELRRQAPGRRVDVLIESGLLAEADPKLMRVALANLIGNAWKFTSRHEHARIEVGSAPTVDDHDGAAFYVKDDGAGFDQHYARNLFGAFQRLHTPDQFEGTGIGLATVQRIVHRHGGTVWAESQVEQGATFWFTLAPGGD